MPSRFSKMCLAVLLATGPNWCLGDEANHGRVSAGGRLIPRCTTDVSLSVAMYELAAPGKTVFHPVLVECNREGRLSLPSERARFLAIDGFALTYLTADEIRTLSAKAGIRCMGLGGEPAGSAAETCAHLWPANIKTVKPEVPLHVLLGLVDIHCAALATMDPEVARKIVLQCTSARATSQRVSGMASVHGAEMAHVCRKFAPDVSFALYDGNLERADIVIGLDIIHEYAKSLGVPAIVNLSASCQAGSHDGRSLWERALGRYVDDDYFLVTSSGNTLGNDVHLAVTDRSLGSEHFIDIPLAVDQKMSPACFELVLWFRGDSPTSYRIIGLTDNVVEVGADSQFCSLAPGVGLLTAYQTASGEGGDANITLAARFAAAPRSPRFIVRLFCAAVGARGMRCDGWIRSTPSGWISCKPYAAQRGTIQSFACAPGVISVGTLRHENGETIFQGVGPTRDGRLKPDIFVQTETSTSYGAAVVSGLLAQAMETNGRRDPRQMLAGLARQYKWLILPEAGEDGHPTAR